ncbi:hypothetical protein BDD12DRAFT_164907 [Trichophaea hybrida]|nr:hypothetical protein BDD12DRAFT_164907 [Trichophaea hybrida]
MAFFAKTLAKTATWLLRLFQNFLALIIIGTCGYMLHEFAKFGFRPPQEVFVPMFFSCIALVVSFLSIVAVCCLPGPLQLIAAIFDFCILSGYIASAVLLFNNYHRDDNQNTLWRWLVGIRLAHNQTGRERRTGALVKLLDACVILMILLFFFTTLLSFCLAILSGQEHYERAAVREEIEEGKHHRRHSRGSSR